MARSDDRNVVDLTTRAGYRPDIAAMARAHVSAARETMGMSTEEFAAVLRPLLGWAPSPGVVANWETEATPPGDVLIAASIVTRAAPLDPDGIDTSNLVHQLLGNRFADVEAVFPTRSEFLAAMPLQTLLADATTIDAAVLSPTQLCQQYADDDLRALIEDGATVRCLFLAPHGQAIAAREREEGYDQGHLSALTEMNRQILLQRVRQRLPESARDRLQVATYDETIRFNILLVNGELCVVQPYLATGRGVESPTFILRRRRGHRGLYTVFEQVFSWLHDQSSA